MLVSLLSLHTQTLEWSWWNMKSFRLFVAVGTLWPVFQPGPNFIENIMEKQNGKVQCLNCWSCNFLIKVKSVTAWNMKQCGQDILTLSLPNKAAWWVLQLKIWCSAHLNDNTQDIRILRCLKPFATVSFSRYRPAFTTFYGFHSEKKMPAELS